MSDRLTKQLDVLCRQWGDEVSGDLDGFCLLSTIAMVESSGGRNNYPNFEPYWIPKGKSGIIENSRQTGRHPISNTLVNHRFEMYGLSAGCSFSSFQILYHTAADIGYTGAPWMLWNDDMAIRWVVALLSRIIASGADTIEKIADAWNSGNHKDDIVPVEYIEEFRKTYNEIYEAEHELETQQSTR